MPADCDVSDAQWMPHGLSRPTERCRPGRSPARLTAGALAAGLVAAATPAIAQDEVVLRDDFEGTSLDLDLWFQPVGPGTFIPRTQFRPPSVPIEVSGGVAHLVVDTFNPSAFIPGDSFFGSEIRTVEVFPLEEGLIFETRSRLAPGTPGGILGSLFMFTTNGIIRDEIDWEILSNDIPGSPDNVLTNVFSNDDFSQAGEPEFVTLPGLDLTEFNTYRVEWFPDRVEWFLNDVLVRTETFTVPDGFIPGTILDPVRVHLNAWAPEFFFADAFNAGLQPAASPFANETFTYEVDFVEIRRPFIGCSVADLVVPSGDVNVFDLLTFVGLFAAGDPAADLFQPAGASPSAPDVFDLLAYVTLFTQGCPAP